PPKSGIVTFERTDIRQDPKITRHIVQAYKKRYKTIDIRSVTVKPTGSKRERFTFTPQCSLKLSKSGLRRKSGTFVVKCGRKRHFFQYALDATIGVYKANHQIKKDKMISLNALEYDVIPFVRLHDIPLSDPIEGRYVARQNIAPGKIVTRKMVQPIPAVTKNERVLCVYEDGPVHIEFEATAMQNGYIGDNITVKKTDGRAIRGVVTGRKRVEIR
ncbi:flagellar basal body P-ring formation chaperone FlgA, partial [Hydrogenimonas sp.]|uniref:flagellar basal body P-ring formation chaperone FlgA n=1 Tax=Hydrogenimonas sp. TaxID=2231112 RepID=UPI0026082E2D